MEKEKKLSKADRYKIIVSAATPIIILLISTLIALNANTLSEAYQNNNRVYEKRAEVYKEIGPILNDYYCYVTYVGHWKNMSPSEILKKKREADKIMYTNWFLFSPDFFEAYENYVNTIFKTSYKVGDHAKINSKFVIHKAFSVGESRRKFEELQIPWQEYFTEKDVRKEVNEKYYTLQDLLDEELKLKLVFPNKLNDVIERGFPDMKFDSVNQVQTQ